MTVQTTDNGTAYEISEPSELSEPSERADAPAPVLALIHGLGLNRHIWQAHTPALTPRYRVLTYDLFGHGDSAPPPAPPSLALFSAQLRDLLDALGIAACAVAGFSLGGMINRRFALDHPHPARAAALAIFNSPHERSPRAQREVEARAERSAAGGIGATLDEAMARWFTAEFQAARPDYIAQTRRWLLANDPVVYAQCRRVLAVGVRELIRPQPPIPCPALVMTCAEDSGSTPAMARAIAGEIPGAQTRIVPGLKHMGLVEAPAQFTAPLLQFLDEVMA